MAELRQAFEAAGFEQVRTILSSGNVVFAAPAASESSVQQRAETAMTKRLGRSFLTIVRPIAALRAMLAADPYRAFPQRPGEKRVVTFLRDRPRITLNLPIERDGARILRIAGRDVYSAYVRSPKGPVFMALLDKTF